MNKKIKWRRTSLKTATILIWCAQVGKDYLILSYFTDSYFDVHKRGQYELFSSILHKSICFNDTETFEREFDSFLKNFIDESLSKQDHYSRIEKSDHYSRIEKFLRGKK